MPLSKCIIVHACWPQSSFRLCCYWELLTCFSNITVVGDLCESIWWASETWTKAANLQSTSTGPKNAIALLTVAVISYFSDYGIDSTLLAQQNGKENFPFCVEDLQAFLGLIIAVGLLCLSWISNYRSKCQILSSLFSPSLVSRDRFMDILWYLHLKDSRQQWKYGGEGYLQSEASSISFDSCLSLCEQNLRIVEKNLMMIDIVLQGLKFQKIQLARFLNTTRHILQRLFYVMSCS